MSKRQADSAIKGFLYQYNKSLEIILSSRDDTPITFEGMFEDIDILDSDTGETTAVQCKYHEAKEAFTLSVIYKPVLQMLEAYSKGSTTVNFRIFIHVPTERANVRALTTDELDEILCTKDLKLKPIVTRIGPVEDKSGFLKQLLIEFGPSLEELEKTIKTDMGRIWGKAFDIDGILYPNAIFEIIKLSAKENIADRTIMRSSFLHEIGQKTHIAFSKWMRFLKNRESILKQIKQSLDHDLASNTAQRYFYFDEKCVEDLDGNMASFVAKLLNKYQAKATHINPPVIVVNKTASQISSLVAHLFQIGIRVNSGFVGDTFFLSELTKPQPAQQNRSQNPDQFRARVCGIGQLGSIISIIPPGQLFWISTTLPSIDFPAGTAIHSLAISCIDDLEFILHLKGALNASP